MIVVGRGSESRKAGRETRHSVRGVRPRAPRYSMADGDVRHAQIVYPLALGLYAYRFIYRQKPAVFEIGATAEPWRKSAEAMETRLTRSSTLLYSV